MMVSSSEWVVIAATAVLGALCWRKDARWIALLLFLSSVIYFYPSVAMLFDGSTLDDILLLRKFGTPDIIKLVAVFTVLVCIGLLSRAAPPTALLRPVPAILATALLVGMLSLDTPLETSRLINTLSLVGMLFVITAGANALVRNAPAWKTRPDAMEPFFICLLLLMLLAVGVAFYEIQVGRAWASFYSSDEQIVVRASSMFFNPNLFGLFCTLLSIFFAFHWHATPDGARPHPALAWGIFLAGLGIYLASSRSMGYLLLLFFISTIVLLPRGTRGRFVPVMLYLGALVLAASLSFLWWQFDREGAEHFWVLTLRLFDSPIQILAICLKMLQIPMPAELGELALKPETVVAVEGRFVGEERDSGLFTAYDDSGWLGITGILTFWALTIGMGLYAYARQRSTMAAYALSTTGVCLAVGIFMRYQVYPVWIWLALMLAPCFAFWRSHLPTRFVRTWI